jgi:predicted RNase H-like nuclease (RuvC/YqgF family)
MGGVELSDELHEVKADVKALLAQGAETKALLETHIRANDADHGRMQAEIERLRDNDREHYEQQNELEKAIDSKTTAVRIDLSKEINTLKLAPGEQAQKTNRKVMEIVGALILGAVFSAVMFWLQNGAPSPP